MIPGTMHHLEGQRRTQTADDLPGSIVMPRPTSVFAERGGVLFDPWGVVGHEALQIVPRGGQRRRDLKRTLWRQHRQFGSFDSFSLNVNRIPGQGFRFSLRRELVTGQQTLRHTIAPLFRGFCSLIVSQETKNRKVRQLSQKDTNPSFGIGFKILLENLVKSS
jgi:hypothetical protein